MPKPFSIENIPLDNIEVRPGRRPADRKVVESLAESIKTLGLRTPITVRFTQEIDEGTGEIEDHCYLVTGRHRLEAVKSLGWSMIPVYAMENGDELDAKLWEIAENLQRSELTVLERSEQEAEWIRLTEEKQKLQSAQVGPNESKREDGRGHRHEGGINAAAKEGIIKTRQEGQRAVKIASITEEAKEAAREAGIDDKQNALLKIAAAPQEQQVAVARQWVSPDRLAKKEDAKELRMQAMERLAERLSDHIPGEEWPELLTELEAIGSAAKPVIDAFRRLNGAVFDRTEASRG